MSEKNIDVLAVMDAAIMRNGHRGDNPMELKMQRDARAAVAELIDSAIGATSEVLHDGASSRAACDRLIAAIAACVAANT